MMTLDDRLSLQMRAKRCRKMVYALMIRHGYKGCSDFAWLLIGILMEHNRALRGA